MHVFVFYFLLIAFSILVYLLFSYSAISLQECSIKSVSQSVRKRGFNALKDELIFLSSYQETGWKEHSRDDKFCVERNLKL